MTNQTIDGALRELLLRVLDPYRPRGQEKARKELRALLDAPASVESLIGRSGGRMVWHECAVCHVMGWYHPDVKWCVCGRPLEKPAAQPQGEPVAWVECSPSWLKAGGDCATAPRLCVGRDGISHLHPAHADQPAPVAVVLPERKEVDKYGEFYDDGYNDCLDDVAGLTATVRIPEPLDHSDGLHTYEYVKGYNDAISLALNPPGAR